MLSQQSGSGVSRWPETVAQDADVAPLSITDEQPAPFKPSASTTLAGSRTARLLPHFATCMIILDGYTFM
jgi:hypothetical protein